MDTRQEVLCRFKLRQQFDNRLRIQEYDVQNASQQTVYETFFEYNHSDQVIRANGGGYFDRYYSYDQVGRMTGSETKWVSGTDYSSYYSGAGYDVWNNLTGRTSQIWGYTANSTNTYQNGRLTQAQGWNSYSGTMPTENWQYDAGGNATNTGEQTHKFDAAGRKIESLEQTPTQQRTELLIRQSYDGDGKVVKRYDREIITGQPNQEKTEYSLISTVLGGAVVATVNPQGVRGAENILEPSGKKVAKNGTTVEFQHEAPFTASSFETTTQTGIINPKEFEPFGGEIPTQQPPSGSPDYIPVGNYQQTGNPLDLQGGCLEDGFPVDCSEMARRMCFGNPRCMNKENRVGGLGYLLAGVQARGDFKGWRGYKQLDGKLVPVVEIARWADPRIMPLIGYAGLADGFAPVFGSASVSTHASASAMVDPSTGGGGTTRSSAADCPEQDLSFGQGAKGLTASELSEIAQTTLGEATSGRYYPGEIENHTAIIYNRLVANLYIARNASALGKDFEFRRFARGATTVAGILTEFQASWDRSKRKDKLRSGEGKIADAKRAGGGTIKKDHPVCDQLLAAKWLADTVGAAFSGGGEILGGVNANQGYPFNWRGLPGARVIRTIGRTQFGFVPWMIPRR